MELRKRTNDNSVKYIHSVNTPPIEISKDTKPTRRKMLLIKNCQKSVKKFIKNITAEGFRNSKRTTNCCFWSKNILIP